MMLLAMVVVVMVVVMMLLAMVLLHRVVGPLVAAMMVDVQNTMRPFKCDPQAGGRCSL